MKIITGKHKGRKILSLETKNFRPTTSKVREAIFSILTSGKFIHEDDTTVLNDAVIMDVFCGTGALGLEALSRGAKHLIMVDNNPAHINVAKTTARNIGEIASVSPIICDATMLPKARIKCNIAFVDPPYNSNLILPTLKSLMGQGWLAQNAIVIIEADKKENFAIPENLALIDERIYSKTKLLFLEYVI